MEDHKFEQDYFKEKHFAGIQGYDLLTKLNLWRPRKYKDLIVQHATPNHKTLLDIGCAFGHFLEILNDDFEIKGIDISEHAIRVARSRLNCELKKCNIEKEGIPFKEKFDIISMISVLEHLNEPKRVLEDVYDKLNDGGLFCFEVPTISNFVSKIFYKLFFSKDESHIYIKSVDHIEALVQSVGFKKVFTRSSMFPIFSKIKNVIDSFSFIFCIFQK